MKYLNLAAIILSLIVATSCGKNGSGGGGGPSRVVQDEDASPEGNQPLEGKYEAILRPLNTSVAGFIPSGKARINIAVGNFEAVTYLEDDTRVIHIQSIHKGIRCPTMADDANGDGLIDAVEMRKAVGRVLIPLDGNLDSQMEGQDFYPVGKAFTYQKTGSVDKIFQDLYSKDLESDSSFGKLVDGSPLNLEGRVVVIHGTAELSKVPESVQTINDQPRNAALPVTCGVIKRVSL